MSTYHYWQFIRGFLSEIPELGTDEIRFTKSGHYNQGNEIESEVETNYEPGEIKRDGRIVEVKTEGGNQKSEITKWKVLYYKLF